MNKVFLIILSVSLLNACSAPITKDTSSIQQSAIALAQDTQLSPQQVLEETRDLQIEAQREDLYFYSPTYITQAEREIRLAEKAFKEKLSNQQIIAYALTGKQLLKRGLETKQVVLVQLKLSLDGLEMLAQLKTDSLLAGDYADIQDDIKDLIVLIEQDNTASALKDQNGVLADIHQLEIKTLKKIHLNPVEHALDKADDADAEDYANRSFEAAEKATERLEIFIEQNSTNRDAIKIQAKQALHIAQHAQHVSIAAQPLLKLKPESAEQHVLFIEKLMARIGNALKQNEINHLPLDSQSIALAQAAETLGKQAKALEKQNQWETEKAVLEETINMLQAQLSKLEATPEASEAEEGPTATTPSESAAEASVNEALAAPLKTNTEQEKVETPVIAKDPAAEQKAETFEQKAEAPENQTNTNSQAEPPITTEVQTQPETEEPTTTSSSDIENVTSEDNAEPITPAEKTEDTVKPTP